VAGGRSAVNPPRSGFVPGLSDDEPSRKHQGSDGYLFLGLVLVTIFMWWLSRAPGDEPAGSAGEHARGVARCYSSYANGGPPINECYSKLLIAHRRARVQGNQEVWEMILDMDRRLVAAKLAYGFSLDTQRLSEAPAEDRTPTDRHDDVRSGRNEHKAQQGFR